MTVEEIEIIVTAKVDEALKEFEKMLPAIKEKMKHYNGDFTEEYIRCFYESLLTIQDVPSELVVLGNGILINVDNGEIKSVKAIVVKFIGADHYKIEIYNFPITIYSLGHMKKLEQTNYRKNLEPKFSRNLNKAINKKEIKKSKKLILEIKKLQ